MAKDRPSAAPARFPYLDHGTVKDVDDAETLYHALVAVSRARALTDSESRELERLMRRTQRL